MSNKSKTGLVSVLVGFGALLTGIVVFGDHLGNLWRNKVWVIGYAIADLLWFEILLVTALLIFYRLIAGHLRLAYRALAVSRSRGYNLPGRWVALFALGLVAIVIAIPKYFDGKRDVWRSYSARVLTRAEAAIRTGNFSRARMHLNVGALAVDSSKCRRWLMLLDRHESDLEFLRASYDALPKKHVARWRLAMEIRRASPLDDFAAAAYKDADRAKSEFETALSWIAEEAPSPDDDEFQRLLARWQDEWPQLSEARLILERIALQEDTGYAAQLLARSIPLSYTTMLEPERPEAHPPLPERDASDESPLDNALFAQ